MLLRPVRLLNPIMANPLKRHLSHSISPPPPKAAKHWPTHPDSLSTAREFLTSLCASPSPTLLLPDCDTDGLTSGTLLSLTLRLLSFPPAHLHVHLLPRSTNLHLSRQSISELCAELAITHVIILDQGSRGGPKPIDPSISPHTKVLLIDHHQSTHFPESTTVLSAYGYLPTATTSLLTYELCKPLHADVPKLGWLAALGAYGDLGNTLKFEAPFPSELEDAVKSKGCRKKNLHLLVPLLNAPRRTPESRSHEAWDLLQASTAEYLDGRVSAKALIDGTAGEEKKALLVGLQAASSSVKAEVARVTRTAPVFSSDSKIALIEIASGYQVHPVIATRWAGALKGKDLEIVMCANSGYAEGMVNISCRICREKRGEVDIIRILEERRKMDEWVDGNIGENFAKGHKEASGGVLEEAVWRAFRDRCLQIVERRKKAEGLVGKASGKKEVKTQKNTLDGYWKKPGHD